MAIPIPHCNDGPNELLRKILLGLAELTVVNGSGTLQSGNSPIADGADVACVVFPTPFTSVPNVVATLSRNAADPVMELNIDQDSITVNSFCVSLGGTTINAGYVIQWMAHNP